MPRTDLTKTTRPGSYDVDGAVLTMAAGDVANGNAFASSGNDLVICHNTNAGAQSVTIQSVADERGREGDLTKSIAAGAYHVFGPIATNGFRQTDGKIYVDVAHAEVFVGVVAL